MNWFKRKPKVEPIPWDGKHELRHVRWFEDFGSSPDDYNTGWVWACTCGTGNGTRWARFWPHTEEGAVQQFVEHRNLHNQLQEML